MQWTILRRSRLRQKHHEDNDIFRKNFVADVKVLCKGFAMNPFQQEKLKKMNNSNISFPEKNALKLKKDLKFNTQLR